MGCPRCRAFQLVQGHVAGGCRIQAGTRQSVTAAQSPGTCGVARGVAPSVAAQVQKEKLH